MGLPTSLVLDLLALTRQHRFLAGVQPRHGHSDSVILQLAHYLVGLLVLAQAHLDLAVTLGNSRDNVFFELCAHHVFSARHLSQPSRVNVVIDAAHAEFDYARVFIARVLVEAPTRGLAHQISGVHALHSHRRQEVLLFIMIL